MRLLRKSKVYPRLRLTISETKSAVASVFGRCFLGLSLWVAPPKDHQTLCLRQGPPGLPRSRPGAPRAGAAAAGLRAVIAALQAFVLGWKGSVALGALGGLGGPRRMDALSAARHPAQALEAGSHYLSGASGYRELLAIGSFWLSGASGDGGQTRPRQTGRRQQPLLAAKQRHSPERSSGQPMAC